MSALHDRLPAYAGFAAVLSAAGLPIYIFAPKYYADSFGVSLTLLGAVLFGLRLFDVVQDPVLGWVAERLGRAKSRLMTVTAITMGLAMVALFAIAPPIAPIWWFGLSVTLLFTCYSFLTINFYAQGVAKAAVIQGSHVRLAAWRESGGLLGVCIAAVLPSVFLIFTPSAYPAFGVVFALAVLPAAWGMSREWRPATAPASAPMGRVLADPIARRLMLIALVNAAPLAMTSTLFLFFVESRLQAGGWEGALLVLFFLSAAAAAPVWSAFAARAGERRVLIVAMCLALASFGVTVTLGAGDVGYFAVICILSGATVGADLTLLPALFARRMAAIAPNGGQGFGIWSFVNKFTLAFAAVAVLPILQMAGFESGDLSPPESALWALTLLYALVPSILKIAAIALLVATKPEAIE